MATKIELTEEELQAKMEEFAEGLANKNKELLGELKKARKAGEITPEQLADVERERDQLQTDLAKAQKDLKTATGNVEKLQKSLNDESAFTQSLLVDNGLVTELGKNGVTNPVHVKAAQAMLRSGVQIVADGEKRIAKVGDKDLAAHVKEWAASDEGKHFVTAATNTGGGATGGGGGGAAGKTVTRAQFDGMSSEQKMTHSKEGGTVTD